MARHTWKAWERWWADTLEEMGFGPTQRIPVTGRSSGDVPDLDNAILAPEVKAGKVLGSRMRKALEQADKAGKATGRIPIVLVTNTSGPGKAAEHVVIIRLQHWERLKLALTEGGQ